MWTYAIEQWKNGLGMRTRNGEAHNRQIRELNKLILTQQRVQDSGSSGRRWRPENNLKQPSRYNPSTDWSGGSGYQGQTALLKVAEQIPGIKVMYLSGYADDVIVHHGVLDEGIHFIQKPFSINALTTKVRKGYW